MNELIVVSVNGESTLDSRMVADLLGIQHENLVDTIGKYTGSIEKFGIIRFQTGILSGAGKPPKYYLLNEDQCYFIITLSKNTEKVVAAKAMVVAAFAKARQLQQPVAMDPFDIIQWNLDRLKAQQREIQSLQSGQTALAEKVNEIEAKQLVVNEDYYALSGYYSLKGRVFKLTTSDASRTGKMLVKKSNELGYIVNYTYSAKYGKVNTYHKFVLQAVLGF